MVSSLVMSGRPPARPVGQRRQNPPRHPGVGHKTAAALVALMPELGALSRHKAAALAGLAPHPNQSGQFDAYRRTKGARAEVDDAQRDRKRAFRGGKRRLYPANRRFRAENAGKIAEKGRLGDPISFRESCDFKALRLILLPNPPPTLERGTPRKPPERPGAFGPGGPGGSPLTLRDIVGGLSVNVNIRLSTSHLTNRSSIEP